MKIQSAQINLSNQHQTLIQTSKTETLRAWVDSKPAKPPANQDSVHLSDAAKSMQETQKAEKTEDDSKSVLPMDEFKAELVKIMIKFLTGYDMQVFKASDLKTDSTQTSDAPDASAPQAPAPPAKAGFGIEYNSSQSYAESETSSFQASGVIKTQDGQTIDFSASLNVSRSYSSEQSISLRAGDAVKIDPLVLNFNGNAAEVSQTKFSFDLNLDGQTEQIAALKPGSGFLALDKNQDGVINDGGELFGPSSGNGFTELANYDQDHNQFIDENDAIFSQLKVFSQNEDGSQTLVPLAKADVGAIYLGNVASPFTQKDSNNQAVAQTVSTGVFLKESGGGGTVQQIDYLA